MSNRENLIMLRINMALLTECGAILPPQAINMTPLTGWNSLLRCNASRLHEALPLCSLKLICYLRQPRQDLFLICDDSFLILHHAIQLCLVVENCSLVRDDSFLIRKHPIKLFLIGLNLLLIGDDGFLIDNNLVGRHGALLIFGTI